MNARFERSRPLRGRLRPPPDKSISHRAALLAAMSREPVRIRNYLEAADTSSTLAVIVQLGAGVEVGAGEVVIRGCGLGRARAPKGVIDVGNAGTLMRLLPGWLAFQEGSSFTLDGDESIRRRPVDRIAEPLVLMGARIDARDGRFAPFTVHGAPLTGIEYELPVASAQVKSCILLAGLSTEATTVIEPLATRDHTERLLLGAGVRIERAERPGGGYRTTVRAADELRLESLGVPGDLSSAAFLIAAAVLVPGSSVRLTGVGVNWTRAGFLDVLKRMGGTVLGEMEDRGSFGAREPIAELEVRYGPLQGTTVEAAEVPLTVDELPLVALLGCFAEGETIVRGAGELRVKESDRIATVVAGLRGLGAQIEATGDGFVVRGNGGLRGGRLHTHGDHRLALLGAVAGLASEQGVEVVGMEAAVVSYPGFEDDLARLMRSGRPQAAGTARPAGRD
ncbi:MAG: 3-phosphoshikimate 1-carboxyvinyltransferase [Solirubrobacteraceae bacterium]